VAEAWKGEGHRLVALNEHAALYPAGVKSWRRGAALLAA